MRRTKAELEKELSMVKAKLEVYEPTPVVTLMSDIEIIEDSTTIAITKLIEKCEAKTGRTYSNSNIEFDPVSLTQSLIQTGKKAKSEQYDWNYNEFRSWAVNKLRNGWNSV